MVKVKRLTNVSVQTLGTEWRLLTEVTVAGEPDQKLLAVEQVIETVQNFRLSSQRMEQLRSAVTRAAMSEVKLFNQDSAQYPISIQVMASRQAVEAQSNLEEYGASGWGFFLIEKISEEDWLRGETSCHMIELFLYLEGDIQVSKKEKRS